MERILPGVYVNTHEEGLITTQPGAVNVIGIIGTANWGPINEVVTIGSFAEAVEYFKTDEAGLTLIKALELAYANGATTVRVVRIASTSAAKATKNLLSGSTPVIKLDAKHKGSYGNNISVTVTANAGTPANRDVKITDGVVVETYINKSSNTEIADAINAQSVLVDATVLETTPLVDATSETFLTGGDSGSGVTNADYVNGLTFLETVDVNIVNLAGQSDNALMASLEAHCQNMALVRRDRIGVGGSSLGENLSSIFARTVKSDRFVFVAPGVKVVDRITGEEVTRAGAYAAAAICGMLASRDVQVSLTNKTLSGVSDVETAYSDANLKDLITNNVLAIKKKNGIRVAKAITTSTNTAWTQITTRRIVDYVKAGTYSAGDQFIGLLNNPRVRSALKGVLDAFLNDLYLNEILVGYSVDVYATRADEIAGVCKVTMNIQPVFSIDYIQVDIYLS